MSRKNLGRTLVILSALLYGMMPFLALKVYDNGGNAVTAAFFRFALSLPALWIMDRITAARQGKEEPSQTAAKRRLTGREIRTLLIMGLLFMATPVLLFESYEYIASGLSTTLHFTFPIVVLLICRVILGKKITYLKGICCVVCVLGVILMSSQAGSIHPLGLIFAGASALTYAAYTVYFSEKGTPEGMSAFRHTFILNLIGSAGILALILALRAGAFRLTPLGWLFAFAVSWGTGIGAAMLCPVASLAAMLLFGILADRNG